MSLQIDTPENVPLEADIAGFGTRCMAAIIDGLLTLALLFIIALVISGALPRGFRSTQSILLLFVGLQFVVTTLYHLFFEWVGSGQTPGKRAFGLRVTQANGLPVTPSAVLIRNLVRPLDFFPVFYSVGLIALFVTKNTQRLGDLAAKTVVVREKRALRLEQVRDDWRVEYQYISRIAPVPAYIQIDALAAQDRREVVDYLKRRAELQQRAYIAGMLAKRLAGKMGMNTHYFHDSWVDAETFLEYVARAFELRDLP
ncbi:MAG: RDD family protein [Chloroflexi bacterium]|nr:RDD family protein [Chloroflexota bacterium]